jgi:hypothetical protein
MSLPRPARAALGWCLLLAATAAAHQQTPPPAAPPASPPPAVKVGEAAPDFTLPYLVPKPEGGFETRQVTLASFKGKQNVVLAFFPAAFSPG